MKLRFTKLGEMAQWVICTAIGKEHSKATEIIDSTIVDMDIVFTVNNIALDFEKVCQAIDEQLDNMITKEANKRAEKLAMKIELDRWDVICHLRNTIDLLEQAENFYGNKED